MKTINMLKNWVNLFIFCCAIICCYSVPPTLKGKYVPKVNSFFKYNDYSIYSPFKQRETLFSNIISREEKGSVVLFLTHLGDLASFELAQQAVYYLPQIRSKKIGFLAITPGAKQESAEKFCSLTNFPIENLYIDKSAKLYDELQFSKGFLPQNSNISPYLKLLPMLMGIGSPGTIPEVLRGYFGDKNAPSSWIQESLRYVKFVNLVL
jgi:hypothetical protein